jgi:hypothetical protein
VQSGESLTRKERKITCPRCHRTINSNEYSSHLQTHRGKHPPVQKQSPNSIDSHQYNEETVAKIIPNNVFPCNCGSKFKSRQELWTHLKTCRGITDSRQTCIICSQPEEIFMSSENVERICPTCALGFFDSKKILGIPVINHMGINYENAFRDKAGNLLEYLKMETLADLGITMALITFSADGSTSFCMSPKGELVFVVNNMEQLRKMNYATFESVVSHEIFHAFIDNNLHLGIGTRLRHSFTAASSSAVQVADDIELIKIAFAKQVEPLILDEINRTEAYYRELPKPVPMKYWVSVADNFKFVSMVSVTWSYASTEWLFKRAVDSKLKEQFSKNLDIIRPHYLANGFPKLKDLIIKQLDDKIVETEKEAEIVFEQILCLYGEFLDTNGLDFY